MQNHSKIWRFNAAKALVLLTVLSLAGCDLVPYEPSGPEIDDFALLDHEGRHHRLSAYADARAIVIFVQGNGCPIVRNSVTALRELRDEFKEQGVRFLMLNANLQDDRQSIAEEASKFGIDFSILVDGTQLVAEALGVERTGEVFVLDGASRKLIYRGAIDDRLGYESQKPAATETYLRDALRAHIAEDNITIKSPDVRGCLVSLPEEGEGETLSYVDDIAPTLKRRCVSCHNPNGMAPWAMTDYEMVRGWSPMMREVVRTGRMPPWHADDTAGRIVDNVSLTAKEKRMLVHWIEAGSPRGEGSDPLKAQEASPSEWRLGPPDLVFEVPEQSIEANGLIPYRYINIDVPVERDIWVRAIDIHSTNPAVTHHANVSINYPETYRSAAWTQITGADCTTPGISNRWIDGMFALYLPGGTPFVHQEGNAQFVPEGSTFRFQMHYTPTGRPEKDITKMGLYLLDQLPSREQKYMATLNTCFSIPSFEKEHEVMAERIIEQEVLVHGLMPHMHYRGKAMRYVAHFPNGASEELLSVPNYSFNWQRYYELAEPSLLPAGTRLVTYAVFDNSAQNPLNPDPSKSIGWGLQSVKEMLVGYVSYSVPYEPTD